MSPSGLGSSQGQRCREAPAAVGSCGQPFRSPSRPFLRSRYPIPSPLPSSSLYPSLFLTPSPFLPPSLCPSLSLFLSNSPFPSPLPSLSPHNPFPVPILIPFPVLVPTPPPSYPPLFPRVHLFSHPPSASLAHPPYLAFPYADSYLGTPPRPLPVPQFPAAVLSLLSCGRRGAGRRGGGGGMGWSPGGGRGPGGAVPPRSICRAPHSSAQRGAAPDGQRGVRGPGGAAGDPPPLKAAMAPGGRDAGDRPDGDRKSGRVRRAVRISSLVAQEVGAGRRARGGGRGVPRRPFPISADNPGVPESQRGGVRGAPRDSSGVLGGRREEGRGAAGDSRASPRLRVPTHPGSGASRRPNIPGLRRSERSGPPASQPGPKEP